MIEPVRKQIVVEASAEKAFRIFTERYDAWWPREHHILPVPLAEAVLEPGVGGRWYEIGEDGSQCDWGKVLIWEPPRRLVMAWQLNTDWQYDPNLVTELEVRFTPLDTARTRVELEHRLLERLGERASTHRDALDSEQGWGMHLQLFAAELEKQRATV